MYDKFIKKFKQEECKLLEDLQDHSKADESFLLTSSYLLDLASRAHELFMSSQPAQKNALLKLLFANIKADGDKLYLELKKHLCGYSPR
jgi:site-specific DNA recombinase